MKLKKAGKRLARAHSILIFRALKLGDMLCAVPAMRALRYSYPRAHITLIGLKWAGEFCHRFSGYIDEFIKFPGYPGLVEQEPDISQIPTFLQKIQKRNFDLCLQLHGSGTIANSLVSLFRAKKTAGFFKQGGGHPEKGLFFPYPEREHEIWRNLKLIQLLGLATRGDNLEFNFNDKDEIEFEALENKFGLKDQEYICIHPGASVKARSWSETGFARVIQELKSYGLRVVLTGLKEEKELISRIISEKDEMSVNLAGLTSLGSLARLVKGARLLISNDTGVSHIASALSVPSVVIVTASDPNRWAPLKRSIHKVICSPVVCRPCSFSDCPVGHICSSKIAPDVVIDASKELLKKPASSLSSEPVFQAF